LISFSVELSMAMIDVLLPVRNGVQYLAEAIESIRSQTFSDWRLIILDHGSSDGSCDLAHKFADKDKRIEVFSLPDADGIAALRNLGLEKCDCRYLVLQDADDVSFANRMEIVARSFQDDSNLLAVGGNAVLIDPAGNEIGRLRMPLSSKAVAAATFFYYPMVHAATAANFPALKRLGAAYGKDILNAVPPSESIAIKRLAEDYILFGQLALLGNCTNVRDPLVKYRRHSGSVGIVNPVAQIELALQISCFLAKSFCIMKGLEVFDPSPFCNHADYVFDFQLRDYSAQYAKMADALRGGLGLSAELERELAFRWVLATRNSGQMVLRYLQFKFKYSVTPSESRIVRNWLFRNVRKGKYVYCSNIKSSANTNAAERM
jgi:glycosyltransferase involved in cell wall biosynthesis